MKIIDIKSMKTLLIFVSVGVSVSLSLSFTLLLTIDHLSNEELKITRILVIVRVFVAVFVTLLDDWSMVTSAMKNSRLLLSLSEFESSSKDVALEWNSLMCGKGQ